MSKESLNVGVVGLGKMGLLHSCILNVLPNVQITALCEKSSITRKFLKKLFNGLQIAEDVEKLAQLDLDAVFITTPIPSHFAVARTIYLKKIARNLFVEKTLARNYEEAKELCKLANSSDGVNMVGYLRRFYVTFRKAKDLLDQDTIGEVASFKAHAYSSDFLGDTENSRAPAARGGVLRDLGCHAVDLASWFFGNLQVESAKLESLGEGCSEYSAYFRVKGIRGLQGDFNISWRMENYHLPEVGLSINGSKGIIEVNDDKLELKLNDGKTFAWYRHDLNDNVPFWLGLPEYYREDLSFIESISKGLNSEPTFKAASEVDKIISQVEKRDGNSE